MKHNPPPALMLASKSQLLVSGKKKNKLPPNRHGPSVSHPPLRCQGSLVSEDILRLIYIFVTYCIHGARLPLPQGLRFIKALEYRFNFKHLVLDGTSHITSPR